MAGILVLGLIISSCTKEKDLEFSNNHFQTDNVLKSGKVNDGSLTPLQLLGKKLFFDEISDPENVTACASCHGPSVGYTGPDPNAWINKGGSVYPGANGSFGNRKPPSAAYATFSPVLYYDLAKRTFVGGNFWDGRATGERLGSPSAEQALGPFLNPREHNVSSPLAVLMIIETSDYISMWETVWGAPLSYSTPDEIKLNYDRVGFAIAAYEGSSEVNQFSSKFDYSQKGDVKLTKEEKLGLQLFNSRGKCVLCHINKGKKPLFTDFTFANLGVPINPVNPVYDWAPDFIDLGLGGYLASRSDYASLASVNMGKQKVPTLRNVDKRPSIDFTKAYMHNGVFKSLKEVVHFYNTRDDGTWPAPEVSENLDTNVGNLGLTDAEEDAIVAFLKTLSDGYN
ncbi:MAG: cytochrome-c peroxidase [Methanococcaceae archaeon]